MTPIAHLLGPMMAIMLICCPAEKALLQNQIIDTISPVNNELVFQRHERNPWLSRIHYSGRSFTLVNLLIATITRLHRNHVCPSHNNSDESKEDGEGAGVETVP